MRTDGVIVEDGTECCPSCGEPGDSDLMMAAFSDRHLPVLVTVCSNRDCRVREFYEQAVQPGTEREGSQ